MLENVELLLVNLFKKFILILIEPARRDKILLDLNSRRINVPQITKQIY